MSPKVTAPVKQNLTQKLSPQTVSSNNQSSQPLTKSQAALSTNRIALSQLQVQLQPMSLADTSQPQQDTSIQMPQDTFSTGPQLNQMVDFNEYDQTNSMTSPQDPLDQVFDE